MSKNLKFVLLIAFLFITSVPTALFVYSQSTPAALPECVSTLLTDNTPTNLTDAQTALSELQKSEKAAKNRAGEADAYYCLGLVQYAQGDFPKNKKPFADARVSFQRAVAAYRETGNVEGEALSLHHFGLSYYAVGDLNNTLPQYQQALRAAQSSNLTDIVADIQYDFSQFYLRRAKKGDLKLAAAALQEAYNGYFSLQKIDEQGKTLKQLADTNFALWQLADASDYYRQASDIFNQLGQPNDEASAIFGRAQVQHHVGDLYAAEITYNQALALYQEGDDIQGQGRTISALGNIYFQLKYSIAENTLNEALQLNRQAGDNIGQSITLSYIGELQLEKGDLGGALASYQSAIKISDSLKDVSSGALAYLGRGRVYAAQAAKKQAELRPALNDFGEATRRYRDVLGDIYFLQKVYISEGWAWFQVNPDRKDKYEQLFFEAQNKAKEIGDARGETVALMTVAEVFIRRTQYDEGLNFLGQAADAAAKVNEPILIGDVYLAMANVEMLRINYPSAHDRYEAARASYQQGGETVKEAVANSKLGTVEQLLGNFSEAASDYESTISALEGYSNEQRNDILIETTLSNTNLSLGSLYLDMGLYDRAKAQLESAVSGLVAANNQYGLADAVVLQGDEAFATRRYKDAMTFYQQAVRTAESSGNKRAQGLALSGIGSTMVAANSATELDIQKNFEGGLNLVRQIKDTEAEMRIFFRLGEASLFQGKLKKAIDNFADAARVATSIGDLRHAGYATLRIAYTYTLDPSDKQNIAAIGTYEDAIKIFVKQNDTNGQGYAFQGLGDVAQRRSQFDVSVDNYNKMKSAFAVTNNYAGEALALTRIGQTYQAQRRNDLAAKSYDDALGTLNQIDMSDPLTDKRIVNIVWTETLRSRANLYRILEDYTKADEELTAAEAQIKGQALGESETSLLHTERGNWLIAQRQFAQATSEFETARSIAQSVGDDFAVAMAEYGIVLVYTNDDDTTNLVEEEQSYNRLLDKFRTSVPNLAMARQTAISFAESYRRRGNVKDAEIWYKTAQNEAVEASDPSGQGYALLELGALLAKRFRFEEAAADYNQAIRLFQQAKDNQGRGEALYRLAEINLLQVNYRGALDQYQEALALFETAGDRLGQAETLTRIGEAYQRQSQLALSLNQHFLALNIIKQMNVEAALPEGEINPLTASTEAHIQRNIGLVRLDLGQIEPAREALTIALNLARVAGNVLEDASTRQLLGQLDYIDQNYVNAMETYAEVAKDYETLNLPQQTGELYIDLGDAQYQQSFVKVDPDLTKDCVVKPDPILCKKTIDWLSDARIAYQRALDVARRLGDNVLEIRSQQRLGQVFNWLNQNNEAQDRLLTALRLAQKIEDAGLQANILVQLGLLSEELGERNAALDYYKQAIDLFEDVYVDIRLEPGQIAFASQNILPYHRLVSLFADSDPAQAFTYAEKGRARSLLYQLGTEQIDFGAGSDLIREYQQKRQIIIGLHQQIDIDLKARETEPNATERARLEQQVDDLRQQIITIQDGLTSLQEQIDTQSAVLAQVTQIKTRSLEDIQANLDADTTILSYYIVPSSSVNSGGVYAFVIGKTTFEVKRLGVQPDTLKLEVDTDFRVKRDESAPSDLLQQLYNDLLMPVEPLLATKQIVIIPHGVLNSLPFNALTGDKTHFFGDGKSLAYASSATLYSLLKGDRTPNLTILPSEAVVFGNPTTPEFYRPTTIAANGTTRAALQPLPGAEIEAKEVATLLNVSPQIQKVATESSMWLEARNASIIHIAAHGVFNPENPLASFLALADDNDNDGALQVREIYSLGLRQNQPLVVLSACNTAVGGASESDDLQSLSGAFLISGARSVVASLWKVDDDATQALMTRFYENLITKKMTVAASLSDAQQYIRQQPQWAAPKYWAAFVLVGLPT